MNQGAVHVYIHVDVLVDEAKFEAVLSGTEFEFYRIGPPAVIPVITPLRENDRTDLLPVDVEGSGGTFVMGGDASVAVGVVEIYVPDA